MHRHHRESYYVVNEGRDVKGGRDVNEGREGRILEPQPGGEHGASRAPTAEEERRAFRFSRIGKRGVRISEELRTKLAEAMTTAAAGPDPDSDVDGAPGIPAGFTYLGQFVDHDLTLDNTRAALGEPVPDEDLRQGRSPALDLDSVYGLGPDHRSSAHFYEPDGRLKAGTSLGVPFPPDFPPANTDLKGFDLPRAGESVGGTRADQRAALIPDARNDENLAVGQLHLAFIRFHNEVHAHLAASGVPEPLLFRAARDTVVKHYQWVLRTDFLPRIVDPEIVSRVFTYGRRHVDAPGEYRPGARPTMPLEFSVAAYRLGHSMIRAAYQWNRVFRTDGPGGAASLALLFRFSGTSGNLTPPTGNPDDLSDLDDPQSGENLRLPSNWIADFRRLFDFTEAGRDDLAVSAAEFNLAKRIDTRLVDPLTLLPTGTFAGRGQPAPPAIHRNLAFRNLARADMVELATGPQLAAEMGIEPLTADQILEGAGSGADLSALTDDERAELVAHSPLWFYVLREAETNPRHPGRLTGVGGRLVAEVFHRAMEGSRTSIVRHPDWRPSLPAARRDAFTMADLLLFAFDGDADQLNPLGDGPIPAS
ncbi:peroxidase family protein [Streptomyces sp. NPDC001514]